MPTPNPLTEGLDTALPGLDNPQSLAALLTETEPEKPAHKPAWAVVDLPKTLAFKDKPKKRIFYDFSEVENAVDRIKAMPRRGETIHAIMDSRFKGIDLVPAVLKLAGRPVRELIVTTLGFNRRDAACLAELAGRGEIQRLALVASNFFAEKDTGAYHYAQERFAEVGARITTSRNHSKLLLFDFGNAHYVNESSANLRSCVSLDQFALSHSKPLWQFHRTWVMRMMQT